MQPQSLSSERAVPGKGRKQHIGRLLYVFRHRGGTWKDLGDFLGALFGSKPWPENGVDPPRFSPPQLLSCRHKRQGEALNSTEMVCHKPLSIFPTFSLIMYELQDLCGHLHNPKPCIGMGSFDSKKNPGIVVASLLNSAKEFLACIGKSDKRLGSSNSLFKCLSLWRLAIACQELEVS